MQIVPTELPEVLIVQPRRYGDSRGYFSETWSARTFAEVGISVDFVQDNHSFSAAAGVVRGLHLQAPPHAQDKLVRVAVGSAIDVAVDVRVGSPTYGAWVAVELSAENGRQLFIPKGFLHGFATLGHNTHFLYKTSDFYAPETEMAVLWSDPDLGIDWRINPAMATVSAKDHAATRFSEFNSPFRYEGRC